MSHYDDCLSVLVPEVEEKLMDVSLRLRVQVACRFVSVKNRRIIYDGSCDGDPLLLSGRCLQADVPHSP